MNTNHSPLLPEDTRNFILAGNARFTLVSKKTGARFTYRVTRAPEKEGVRTLFPLWFVSVLTGSNNEGDYTYLGTISRGNFLHGRKSRIDPEAKSSKAIA